MTDDVLAKLVHENGPIVVDWAGEELAWRPLDYGAWTPFATRDLEARIAELEAERDRLCRALERAANTGYLICANTRHVTLGDKVRAAILSTLDDAPSDAT